MSPNIRSSGYFMVNRVALHALLLLVFMAVWSAAPPRTLAAEDPIKPYGDFQWGDSYTDVLKKLAGMKGLQDIYKVDQFAMRGQEANQSKRVTKILLSTPESIDLLQKHFNCEKYLDGIGFDGKKGIINITEKLEVSNPFHLSVNGIDIYGERFTLILEFWPSKGLLLDEPEDALCVQGTAPLPMVLVRTMLRSPDHFPPGVKQKVLGILHKKYGKYAKRNDGVLKVSFGDRHESMGTYEAFCSNDDNYVWYKEFSDGGLMISYENMAPFKAFEASFKAKYAMAVEELRGEGGGGEEGL